MPTPEINSMYGDRVECYDLIYHCKPYEDEASRLHDLLAREGVPDGARILEAACGTGRYLEHLRHWYRMAGLDLSAAMVERARSRVPEAEVFVADMADFAVDESVGALVCLFSSIGYVHPIERLRAAARCFAAAIAPGGVLVVEPWLGPDVFTPGRPFMDTYEDDDLKLCRTVISRREGDLSIFDFHWLAARKDAPEVEHFVDRHVLWLCPTETHLEVFDAAGFECEFEPEGLMGKRGLIVGRRRG